MASVADGSGSGSRSPSSSWNDLPRYLVCFAEEVDLGLVSKVKFWCQEAGLLVEGGSTGESTESPGRLFLVVTAGQEQLEREAERLGYLKPHRDLVPYVAGQGLGLTEFRRADPGFSSSVAGFWPCEKVQLLRSLMDFVPNHSEALLSHLKSLEGQEHPHSTAQAAFRVKSAIKVSQSLLASLRIAGLVEHVAPMQEERSARLAVWQSGLFKMFVPVEPVQEYFGSQVAFYFAWLNSFTAWLSVPALIGLACYAHMQVHGFTVDDHPFLPFYSLFAVLWGVVFVCHWERASAAWAWKWGVFGAEIEEQVRPEFTGELRCSPATGRQERHYPSRKRYVAYLQSVVVTSVMLCIAFFVMICSLNLQGYMECHATSLERIFYIPALARYSHPGAVFDPNQSEYFGVLALVPVLMHTLLILNLNKLYRHMAEWLTWNENHRLTHEHDNSLIIKRFLFEAFDCYIALFYVGFIQQDVRKLRSELVSLYTVDSLRRSFCETLLPLGMQVFSRQKSRERYAVLKKSDRAHQVEALKQLEQAEYEHFDDFMEMIIAFGYVTLFASAFPLAGLLTIACNLVEMKSDLFKLTRVYQRPVSARVAGIGTWAGVLKGLVCLSIVTNAMLFAMSEQLAHWAPFLYRQANEKDVAHGLVGHVEDFAVGAADLVMRKGSGRYVVLIAVAVEHCVGLAAFILAWCIPRVPQWVLNEAHRSDMHRRARAGM
ncbi:unnamed protein product [Polarella glacialis]|uniref:Anoctamin transmembrane domain-containing protein n=1 Tax=Polarella glacialis TaxID=89957 RepID=A0A813EBY6_POLGL|nr:unnamed protein product [Polarella glacialis]